MAKKQRYLKKLGEGPVRLFGWTKILSKQKDMLECDKYGNRVFGPGEDVPVQGVDALTAFELGWELYTIGEKKMRDWLAANSVKLNRMPLEVQMKVADKWMKIFGDEPMPEGCSFVAMLTSVEADSPEEEPEEEKDNKKPKDE